MGRIVSDSPNPARFLAAESEDVMGRAGLSGIKRWEWVCLGLILVAGVWLRFSNLDLLEFKADEAVAAHLALQFVMGGELPTAGLMSSVGVTNPPLFIYLLIPMFTVTTSPVVVSCVIGLFALAAVVMCWHIGRKYYGAFTGLAAAAMFAASPWAVIYSRKIWAQDFVPLFATGTMWAAHALVAGKRPSAVFWLVLLPLCVIQIHFSGLALTAVAFAIILVLRPKIDWRFAVAGFVAAVLLALPYVAQQSKNNWAEFRRMAEMKSGRNWQIPEGMTIRPDSGYPLPRRPGDMWVHALAIMNAGEIEDVLGLSTSAQFDTQRIYSGKSGGAKQYFSDSLRLGDSVLTLQRLAFVGAFVWLVILAAKAVRRSNKFPFAIVEEANVAQTSWILALWIVVPLAVFWAGGLWTYLSYFAILFPAHFFALGFVGQEIANRAKHQAATVVVYAALGLILLWNVAFMVDFYGFIRQHGGAHGTYGTTIGHKQRAARFLAERANVSELTAQNRLLQMDHIGRTEIAQIDLPFLAMLEESFTPGAGLPTNTVVLVVDENRSSYNPAQVQQLAALSRTNFGPMRLYFVTQ